MMLPFFGFFFNSKVSHKLVLASTCDLLFGLSSSHIDITGEKWHHGAFIEAQTTHSELYREQQKTCECPKTSRPTSHRRNVSTESLDKTQIPPHNQTNIKLIKDKQSISTRVTSLLLDSTIGYLTNWTFLKQMSPNMPCEQVISKILIYCIGPLFTFLHPKKSVKNPPGYQKETCTER